MSNEIINKTDFVKAEISRELMLLNVGDKLRPVSDYQYDFKVARGTIQKAIQSLCDDKTIQLDSNGRNGSLITFIDYVKLQHNFIDGPIIGALTIPSTIVPQGLITALNRAFEPLECDLIYARKSETRLQMLSTDKCQFVVCSLYSAKKYLKRYRDLKILFNFGPYTYMSEHVLVFHDKNAKKITSGMKVGYDPTSLDNKDIIDYIVSKTSKVELVPIKARNTIKLLKEGYIDVGLWTKDDIIDDTLGVEMINSSYIMDFTTAVLIIRSKDTFTESLLNKYIDPSEIIKVQYQVKNKQIPVDY